MAEKQSHIYWPAEEANQLLEQEREARWRAERALGRALEVLATIQKRERENHEVRL